MNIFDIHSQYEHEEMPDNLKVALIQQKELSADQSGQTIFDAEMVHFQGSKQEFINYCKVIYNTYRFFGTLNIILWSWQ